MKNLFFVALAGMLLFFCSVFGQSQSTGTFSTELQNKRNYGYVLQSPESKRDKKPLIVFLHGSGEKGTDLEKVKAQGPLKYTQLHKLDAFILAPQCPSDAYWDAEALYRLIKKIESENNIDPQRIYLTGLSMGGWGTWNLAVAHPEMFAALVPICGYVDRIPMVENCKLAHLPIRIFHGLLDDVVDVSYSVNIYKKIKPCSASNVELTIFDDANHDSWTRVYANPEIYDWMLKQTKK